MPRGIPLNGKRQLDPTHKPGPKPKLPPNTYQRSYRATQAEHEELTSHLAKIRGEKEQAER